MLLTVNISNAHNLSEPDARPSTGNFGVRVTVPDSDPFSRLIDADWSNTHWFATRHERDAALADMARKHEYSRNGDLPTLVFTPVERENRS